jgi:hypothetical protein
MNTFGHRLSARRQMVDIQTAELRALLDDIQVWADDYSGSLFLRCPKPLPRIIKQAARGSMTSASAYVRGAILSQLRRDGYDLNGDAA